MRLYAISILSVSLLCILYSCDVQPELPEPVNSLDPQDLRQDVFIDCTTTHESSAQNTLLEEWGLGYKDGEVVVWNEMLDSYPNLGEVDSSLGIGAWFGWYVSYDEDPGLYIGRGEAGGYFGATYEVLDESGAVETRGLTPIYACIQNYKNEWFVQLGPEMAENVQIEVAGSNKAGETVYRLDAHLSAFNMNYTIFYVD
jgi:hypothetical protein